tara:strand:+ start:1143 stop:2336 length:1194 start_codon:yes stop_codon:yes gene_type:complete
MPTANITWTNRSTNDNPTGTKIERTEGFPFGHANAPTPVEVANGNTGGLDPELSGVGAGSYADTTISGDTSYAYRVSTLKGAEVATSIATPLEYIYDSVNDLGYPGGSPETTSQYTISTTPFLHLDMNRSSTGYVDDDAMTEGFAGQIRHGDFIFTTSSYSGAPTFSTYDLGNGIVRNFARQAMHSSKHWTVEPSASLDKKMCPDGMTAFFVLDINSMGYLPVSDTIAGNIAYPDGIHYAADDIVYNTFKCMGTSTPWTPSHPGPPVGANTLGTANLNQLHVLGYRVNNDAAAFATGNIQGQLFDGGDLVGTSANRHSVSYHNNPASPDYTNNLGAGAFNRGYGMQFLSSGHVERVAGEVIYFDSALSLSEMNVVNAYLCNKYNIAPTTIAANDLVN